MGEYRIFLQGFLAPVSVIVWWAFDSNLELVDVFVDKQTK
jgi:hypothetical protein